MDFQLFGKASLVANNKCSYIFWPVNPGSDTDAVFGSEMFFLLEPGRQAFAIRPGTAGQRGGDGMMRGECYSAQGSLFPVLLPGLCYNWSTHNRGGLLLPGSRGNVAQGNNEPKPACASCLAAVSW